MGFPAPVPLTTVSVLYQRFRPWCEKDLSNWSSRKQGGAAYLAAGTRSAKCHGHSLRRLCRPDRALYLMSSFLYSPLPKAGVLNADEAVGSAYEKSRVGMPVVEERG